MSDVENQLATLKTNNEADATALAALENDLNTPATESTGDQVLAAALPVITSAGLIEVFGADTLVSVLTAAGYAVTAPEAETSSDGSTDAPSE